MEFEVSFSLALFFATLFSSFILVIGFRSSKTHDTNNNNLPPQPWKIPLIGHIHHLLGDQPHKALAKLAQKLGPIVSLQLGQVSIILISSPSSAKEVMKTQDISFASRPKFLNAEIFGYNYKDIAFSPYGDYWRQMRKICVFELLNAKKVHSFRSLREQESWDLVKSITNHGSKPINLTEKIFTIMNTIICRVVVGSKCKDQTLLLALLKKSTSLSSGFDVSDLFPSVKILPIITGKRKKLVKIHMEIDEIFDSIIFDHQERRSGGMEDLLDVLLRLKDDGGLQFPLTFDNVKAVIMDMFIGGTDTSSVTTEWAVSELMRTPRVLKKAQDELRHTLKGKKTIHESDIQELDYLKLVIKETLRLHPPAPLLLPRECREKCKIGGYDIPINTKVIVNAWKIGRDPDYWNDPERFIPERFSNSSFDMVGMDFEYLPFGAGRRMCPGMSLGLTNVELVLATLLYHFDWDLPNGAVFEDLDMSESFGASLARENYLVLVPRPHVTN